MKIGIYHLKTKMFLRRYRLDKLREIASKARRKDVDILCLSPLINVEDLVENYSDVRLKSVIRSYAEKIPSTITDPILDVAEENGLYVVAGGFLERAGPKLFISSIVASPLGKIITKYRKIAITSMERSAGISPGKRICTFKVKKVKFGILLDHDLLVPELSRALKTQSSNVVLVFVKKKPRLKHENEMFKAALMVRSYETNMIFTLCGSTVERYGSIIYEVPSMIATPNNGIELVKGGEEELMVKELEDLLSSDSQVNYEVPQTTLNILYKMVIKQFSTNKGSR